MSIREKVEQYTLIAVAILAAILSVAIDLFDLFPFLSGITPSLIVILLALTAMYLVFERRSKLEKIDQTLVDLHQNQIGSQNLIREISEMSRSLLVTEQCAKLGIRNMWREREHIQRSFWNEFTAQAHSDVWMLGIVQSGYATDSTFHRIVSDGTARGCRYRILLLDPDSAAAEELDRKEGATRGVQGRILQALARFQEMQKRNTGKPGAVEIRVTADVPHVNIVRSDSELLVTQYMPPLLGYNLFTLHVQKTSTGIFEQYETYFEATWEKARVWENE